MGNKEENLSFGDYSNTIVDATTYFDLFPVLESQQQPNSKFSPKPSFEFISDDWSITAAAAVVSDSVQEKDIIVSGKPSYTNTIMQEKSSVSNFRSELDLISRKKKPPAAGEEKHWPKLRVGKSISRIFSGKWGPQGGGEKEEEKKLKKLRACKCKDEEHGSKGLFKILKWNQINKLRNNARKS